MFKYKVVNTRSIERYSILRETSNTIWRTEHRKDYKGIISSVEVQERKKTDYASWHDNYDLAKQSIVDARRKTIKDLEAQLVEAKEQLVKAQNLKEDAV